MYSLVWGKAQQLSFADDHEYYRALGSLCRHDSYTITFETNSETESWGDAFRIKCLRSDAQTPDAFINAMRTARRINCNDYVQNLYEYHDFDFDVGNKVLIGNYNKVKQTVPASYHFDFDEGYNLRFTRYGTKKSVKKTVSSYQTTHKSPKPLKERTPVKPVITTAPSPAAQPKPKPKLVDVKVGDVLIHRSWGKGKVYAVEDRYIRISFNEVGDKSFVNPDAFDKGYLQKV